MTLPFLNLDDFFNGSSHLLGTLSVGFLPIFLHLIDKIMEQFAPLGGEYIQDQMAHDGRKYVSNIGQSKDRFNGVATFFDYERAVHFVVTMVIFNIASLYFAQVECTKSWLQFRPLTFVGMFALCVFLFLFLLRLAKRTFDPAADDPVRRWKLASVIAFGVVLLIETNLHLTCEIST